MEHTLVGCPGGPDAEHIEHDIQLSGLGIQPRHCLVEIVSNEVFLIPFEGARTCVNGSVIHERTRVKHGNRILWGNNHFFRLNCPKKNSVHTMEPEQKIDFDFAQQELMMNEYSNDPISEAIMAMEKQYEEDKQEALEKQRQMYEQQMQMLRNQLMSPGTPSGPYPTLDVNRLTPTSSQSAIQKKYQQWAQERDKIFKQSLAKLREEVVKANSLVREANFLAQEMGKKTEFHVTLQIPASNLSPNRRRGAFVSEPAILVRRKGRGSQIWSMEKFENKIIDMRDMYEERKNQGLPMRDDGPLQRGDPFYESQENHNLIGVANVFLECLFYDVKLDYHVPIISQQGEVAGKLHVEISKLGGDMLDRFADIHVEDSEEESSTVAGTPAGSPMIVRVCIHGAKGLPRELSHFVFCQYTFWGQEEPITVAPVINPEASSINPKKGTMSFRFDHRRDFKINVIDEFVEHCYDRALSIEVWGHRIVGFGSQVSYVESMKAKTLSLTDRWSEVMRKIEVRVEIQELNDQGEYAPVEVKPQPDVPCAGVFQLRQGHSRRIQVRVKPVAHSGTLPLICEAITSISVGSICGRFKLQKGLDSYQEEDLNLVRDRWSEALARRKNYLDEQIQKLINKTDKSESDSDRERALIEQWVCLTEERNAVMVPAAGSGIPGAPADWDAPPDMEQHMPVLFLDLNADDMSTPNAKEGLQAAGMNSILVREQPSTFLSLPIIKTYTEKENVCAVVSWDSSIHDSNYLNRLTSSNERVYMILKAIVRLSHPASMELVLRKRLCINIYTKHTISSFTDKLKQRFIGTDVFRASGITYDVVSNIPKASEDLENMETLAQMAASSSEVNDTDGETYIEKYIKGVSAVESILTLDRLRQEVAVKELMAIQGRNLTKTTSVPNINQHFMSPPRLDQKMRFDSFQDLSAADRSFSPGESSFRKRAYSAIGLDIVTIAKELTYKCSATLARPTFLDLRANSGSNSAKLGGKLSMSPLGAKMIPMKPLRTLQEEQQRRESKPLLYHDTEEEEEDSPVRPMPPIKIEPDPHSVCSDDFQEFESYHSQQSQKQEADKDDTSIPHSGTNESLAEIQTKNYTPSMASSGYGSQAVSTLTLSSEDSLSLRSSEDNMESVKDKMARRSQMLGQTSSVESDLGEDEIHASQQEEESHNAQKQEQSHAAQTTDESHVTQKEKEVDKSDAAQKENETSFIVEVTESKNVLSQTSKVAMEDNRESLKETKTEAQSNASQIIKEDTKKDKMPPIITVMNAEVKSNALQTKEADIKKYSCPEQSIFDDDIEEEESEISDKFLDLHISEEDLRIDPSNNEMGGDKVQIPLATDDSKNRTKVSENLPKGIDNSDVHKVSSNSDIHKGSDSLKNPSKDGVISEKQRESKLDSAHDKSLQNVFSDKSAMQNNQYKDNISVRTGRDDSLSKTNTSVVSESSSGYSRSLVHSESFDPYSEEAMEELERLGEDDGPDNSEFLSIDDRNDSNLSTTGSTLLERSSTKSENIEDRLHIRPENQSTPKSAVGLGSSEKRPRPVSCLVFSPGNEEFSNSLLEEKKKRNSFVGNSDEHLSEDSASVCSFGSRADLDRLQESPVPSWVQVGESVQVIPSRGGTKMTGVVQYVGTVEFASGPWVGVELDLPEGRNTNP
ncbi:hypothetical protein ACJMK2_000704 [Sinanodonta woodiana]|uniref:CAP-Gly domain-containing protein n=1 Tax=Sinanodonta woodiana TaxID=1069815 RepID=A0ABD3XQ33_SINWO